MASPERIDIVEKGLSRLMTQWDDKPVVQGLIKSFLENIQVVEDQNIQLLEERSIDSAVGIQLDILGLLIGQSRNVVEGAYGEYFGFLTNPNGVGFNQAPFFVDGDPIYVTKTLGDDQYRVYLKARAASNGSSGTPEDVIEFFQALFGSSTNTVVKDIGIAHALISVGHIFTDEERLIVLSSETNDWIPRPAGVTYTVQEFVSDGYFGFSGDLNAAGFNVGSFMNVIGNI